MLIHKPLEEQPHIIHLLQSDTHLSKTLVHLQELLWKHFSGLNYLRMLLKQLILATDSFVHDLVECNESLHSGIKLHKLFDFGLHLFLEGQLLVEDIILFFIDSFSHFLNCFLVEDVEVDDLLLHLVVILGRFEFDLLDFVESGTDIFLHLDVISLQEIELLFNLTFYVLLHPMHYVNQFGLLLIEELNSLLMFEIEPFKLFLVRIHRLGKLFQLSLIICKHLVVHGLLLVKSLIETSFDSDLELRYG